MAKEQLNIFDFGLNEDGEYVNIVESEQARHDAYYKEYSFEEIIKGHEDDAEFVFMAHFHMSCLEHWGRTVEDIQKLIQKDAATKTYHFGNTEKLVFAYSYKLTDLDDCYIFCIENQNYIVAQHHHGNIDDILTDKVQICYPACEIDCFKTEENTVVDIHADERDQIFEELEIFKLSTNRIVEGRKLEMFCEAQHPFSAFVKHWGQSKVGGNEDDYKTT